MILESSRSRQVQPALLPFQLFREPYASTMRWRITLPVFVARH